VSGDVLDNNTGDAQKNTYYSIFFYASWCPFSRKTRPIFDALSSMFPQIRHLAIEESSAMPRYICICGYYLLFVDYTLLFTV